MESTSVILDVLSDLLKINRDRVIKYKKASNDTDDLGLKALFQNNADQSRKNISEIINEVMNYNENSKSAELTNSDKIFDAWATFKAKFSGNGIKNVLTTCETMDSTALQIYKKAKNKKLGAQLTDLIEKHELSLKSSHEVISVYRQAYMKLEKLYS